MDRELEEEQGRGRQRNMNQATLGPQDLNGWGDEAASKESGPCDMYNEVYRLVALRQDRNILSNQVLQINTVF